VNVFSDSCGAVLIAKTEGETEVLKLQAGSA
jgi:3-oxoacyl-[acyl-carrier-protein] synthase III